MTVDNGRVIGKYRIVSLIGRGAMGEVYRAIDTTLGRQVALKILPDDVARDPRRIALFEREAWALASMPAHPNIATIYETGAADGYRFLALEFVDGKSLESELADPLPLDDVVDVGIQIAEALCAAHAGGIVHRDIKPANIIRTPAGAVKVLDFGIAKPSASSALVSEHVTQMETSPGVMVGTPEYMSPEQTEGQSLDGRSDLFSLGIVLYRLATGRLPFKGSTPWQTIEEIRHSEPQFDTIKSVPFADIVRRCLRKDRTARYASAVDLLSDLGALRHDRKRHQRPSMPERRTFSFGTATEIVTAIFAAATALVNESASFPFEVRFGLVVVCAIVGTATFTWEHAGRSRHLTKAVIVAAGVGVILLLQFVIRYDTLRVMQPEGLTTSGRVELRPARTPVLLTVNAYVEMQAAAITDFTPLGYPRGQPANISDQSSFTTFDRQLTVDTFGRPQYVTVDYTLASPAILRIEAYVDDAPGVRVLSQEDLSWYNDLSLVAGLCLIAAGLALFFWRSRRRS